MEPEPKRAWTDTMMIVPSAPWRVLNIISAVAAVVAQASQN